jgi:gamma-glutamyltranspeptidase/glutathione hydrolase
MQRDLPLGDAIAHPRLHVDLSSDVHRVAFEPGIDVPEGELPNLPHAATNMYFGGVAAALCERHVEFQAAADPRREGGTCIDGT